MVQPTTLFSVVNFDLAPTPPGYFVPSTNGSLVQNGHIGWQLTIDTTGLPAGQLLAEVQVQYRYQNVQLGVTGMPNQGQVTNTDGSVTQIPGGTFTGWIDDCSAPLPTTFTNKQGQVVHQATLSCGLNRIPGAYPDRGRFLVKNSPGYVNVPSAVLTLN